MANEAADELRDETPDAAPPPPADVPRPTARFRRRAWIEFQRALDPLAPPNDAWWLEPRRGSWQPGKR